MAESDKQASHQAAEALALRHGLALGKLSRDAEHIEKRALRFRRQVEQAVVEAKGEITLTDAATIQTACRWERHAMLCQRWLARESYRLSPEQRQALSRDVARASAERDKCLRALEIDKPPDPWAAIYTTAVEPQAAIEQDNDSQAATAAEDATAGESDPKPPGLGGSSGRETA